MRTPDRPLAYDLPQLAVDCPHCGATAGQLCTSHGGTRPRRTDTHIVRRQVWADADGPVNAEADQT
ncbi:hypothetical protein [Streptomyces sp. WMMB303]|uniref:zinc finger domain-containing protein n=1 Tax=Streptomyces sp. WMMB303 TaxID=3034154 RepID=UPI0023EB776F|nr:hypothetical protein [Streptomyces sp. WMMB303]MDF4254641.1 hypothetical protein [Streptomyces sp. WMMB303]